MATECGLEQRVYAHVPWRETGRATRWDPAARSPRAVAPQETDVTTAVGRYQVKFAVAIHIAHDQGPRVGAGGEVGVRPEAARPSPSRTLTVLPPEFATARSRKPSLLKSPTTTAWGDAPTS